MARGVDRRHIFVDDEDYAVYRDLLGAVVERQRWRLLTYSQMPNHVHLLVETPETNLGNGMQWLHSRYARYFNTRHGRSGHLFEDRFRSPLITCDADLVRTTRYIVRNPVAARLVARPEDWKWGSHAAVASAAAPVWLGHDRLEERLEAIPGAASYATLIEYDGTVTAPAMDRALADGRVPSANGRVLWNGRVL
jgi:putative transposase